MGEGNPVAAEEERGRNKREGEGGVEARSEKCARHTLEIRPGTQENSE